MQEKVTVFIDGGNFYHLVLKKLNLHELDFNFDSFAKFLIGERTISDDGKRFYVGTVREKDDGHENKKAMANQTKLFSDLIKYDWIIITSKLRTRFEKIKIDDRVSNHKDILNKGITEIKYKRSREKGIDVSMAVDLISGAVDKKYDTAIVVSSDSDLIPAINYIRRKFNKKIEYIGFSISESDLYKETRPTKTMIYNSDVQRVLAKADLADFLKKKLF